MLISHGVPPLGVVKQGRGGKNKLFSSYMHQYLENGKRYVQSYYIVANRNVHMRFQLAPRSMTLDVLELYKFEFSENFAGFRTQQQLNK